MLLKSQQSLDNISSLPVVGSAVPFIHPYARVFKLIILSDDRTKALSSTNPLTNFLRTIPKDRLIRMVTRSIISYIMDLNEQRGAALTQTPYAARFGFYMLYSAAHLYFSNGDSCHQFIQNATTSLLPLQLSRTMIDEMTDAVMPLLSARTQAQLALTASQCVNLQPALVRQVLDIQSQERRFLSAVSFDSRSVGFVVSGILCALIIQHLITLVG